MAMHNPPHPGEALREDVLPAINMTVSGLARHIGYSRGQLSTVLNGRAAISADLAHRLELASAAQGSIWPNRRPTTCGRRNTANIPQSRACSSPDPSSPSPDSPAASTAGLFFAHQSGRCGFPFAHDAGPVLTESARMCR